MKFLKVTNYLPTVGNLLTCDLYLKTSDAKVLLIFRMDTILTEDDVNRLNKYLDNKCVFIKEDQYFLLFKAESEQIKNSLENKKCVDAEVGFHISKSFFKAEEILLSDKKLDSMINIASHFIMDLLKSSKEQRSQALADILISMSGNEDMFINHANQVAAVSTMIALMTDNISLDNIIEINLVSILHGMGLMIMNKEENLFFSNYANVSEFKESIGRTDELVVKKVLEKHFDGHNKLTLSDNIVFLQHLALIEHNIDKINIKNIKNQGVLKTIGDFKLILSSSELSTKSGNPYISAKILIIGDRLVSLMNFYKKNPSFVANSIRDLETLNNTPKSIFDKKILERVLQMA